jgi:hypothetical protein
MASLRRGRTVCVCGSDYVAGSSYNSDTTLPGVIAIVSTNQRGGVASIMLETATLFERETEIETDTDK